MNKPTYCVFSVADYKGGELFSEINLSKKDFINVLTERFEYNDDFDENSSLEDIEKIVRTEIEDPDFLSTYAGGDGFCGKLYENIGGKLKEVQFSQYIKDIAEAIKAWDY